MPTKGRVIVIGSSNTDLVVHTSRLPLPGQTEVGGDMITFAGGKGANQAVAAARAGADVVFIGAFGDDDFGRARRKDLEQEGVDCSGCVMKKNVPSGVALIGIGQGAKKAKAENLILVAPGANMRLTPEDVRKGMPKNLSKMDVVLCSLEVPIPAVLEALKLSFTHSKGFFVPRVIVNPAPLPPKGIPKEIYEYCFFLTPNEHEFKAITGVNAGTTAAWKAAQRLKQDFIVTRGAEGVDLLWLDGPPIKRVKAPKVKPVDTVGAGDCFNGCLAAQLALNYEEDVKATQFAVCAAALKVTRHGAQAGMPYRAEVLKFLKKAH
jgi:ribokinase